SGRKDGSILPRRTLSTPARHVRRSERARCAIALSAVGAMLARTTMRSVDEIRSELYRAAALPDADVAAAALWIAAEEYPDLDHDAYLGYLDEVACAVRTRVGDDASADELRRALTEEVFVRQGFTGNATEYYDPRNS